MKKILSILLASALAVSALAGCSGKKEEAPAEGESSGGSKEGSITVAAIETAYGSKMWEDVCAAFTEETGIKVELVTDKNLEDVIGPSMQDRKSVV